MPDVADWNRSIIEQFRASGGQAAGPFPAGILLLLHHRGAVSGTERVSPLIYQRVGDDYAIFASAGGAPHDPQWYRNLLAHPDVTIEVASGGGADTSSATTMRVAAREATGAERDRIWQRQKDLLPQYAKYEQKTSRTIPVVLLAPEKEGHE